MGSVGSIEKVLVFGILGIILLILAVAWNGRLDDGLPELDPKSQTSANAPLQLNASRTDTTQQPPQDPVDRINVDDDILEELTRTDPKKVPDITSPQPIKPVKPVDDASLVPEAEPRGDTYSIKSGDTFEKIALREYGDRSYVQDLIKANEDIDPRKLRVGQVIQLPRIDASAPEDARERRDSEPKASPRVQASDAGGRQHVVVKGDTLYGIARQYYGSVARWKEIRDANNLQGNDLRVGQVLRLP